MKILVISDIHANLTALEAVLSSAGAFDATWCQGDLVGYGPDPNECVERVRHFPTSSVCRATMMMPWVHSATSLNSMMMPGLRCSSPAGC